LISFPNNSVYCFQTKEEEWESQCNRVIMLITCDASAKYSDIVTENNWPRRQVCIILLLVSYVCCRVPVFLLLISRFSVFFSLIPLKCHGICLLLIFLGNINNAEFILADDHVGYRPMSQNGRPERIN